MRLVPELAGAPVDARKFRRGGGRAIGENGLPILNGRNNRGEDAFARADPRARFALRGVVHLVVILAGAHRAGEVRAAARLALGRSRRCGVMAVGDLLVM